MDKRYHEDFDKKEDDIREEDSRRYKKISQKESGRSVFGVMETMKNKPDDEKGVSEE